MINALDQTRINHLESQIYFLHDELNKERVIRQRVQTDIKMALRQVSELVQAINELTLYEGDIPQKTEISIQTIDSENTLTLQSEDALSEFTIYRGMQHLIHSRNFDGSHDFSR